MAPSSTSPPPRQNQRKRMSKACAPSGRTGAPFGTLSPPRLWFVVSLRLCVLLCDCVFSFGFLAGKAEAGGALRSRPYSFKPPRSAAADTTPPPPPPKNHEGQNQNRENNPAPKNPPAPPCWGAGARIFALRGKALFRASRDFSRFAPYTISCGVVPPPYLI